MSSVGAGWWYGIFLDAYTYSTNYLLFTITILITSVLFLWIYEKPQFYKVFMQHLPIRHFKMKYNYSNIL